jgi:hypothetical protein
MKSQLFTDIPMLFIMFSVLFAGCSEDAVLVSDFGAVTDDGMDDTEGITAAIEYASEKGIKTVIFDEGTYDFNNLPGRDASEGKRAWYYINLTDINGMELLGAVDVEGKPATKWIINNDLKELQPGILKIESGSDVSMKNFTVDMVPFYNSAGEVVNIDADEVTVKILDGHPYHDGQPAFVMGTYDLEARKAKTVRITWDHEAPHTEIPVWHRAGDPEDRMMKTSCKALTEYCKTGDGVFWFQSNYTAGLLLFSGIQNLWLENIHIWNGHGFPLKSNFNYNVTYKKVMLYPPGNRIATACRDGFKLLCNGGTVVMDSIYIDGCLGDDGQNIHGLWLTPQEVRGSHEMTVHYPISKRPFPMLTPGHKVRLLDDKQMTGWESTILTCERGEEGRQLLTFEDALPDWVHDSTPVEAQEWLPETMLVKNSVFRNTGRYGIIMKASNAIVENSLFENNVAGIRIGGEWHPLWLESTHSENFEIRNCTFKSNDLDILYGGRKADKAIHIHSHSMPPVELMQDIRIHHNTFENEGICVDVSQCNGLWFWENELINCGQDLQIAEEGTSNIYRTAPE